jgi:hypothetical protein
MRQTNQSATFAERHGVATRIFERFANNQRITHGEMFVPFKSQTKIT